MDSYTLYVPAAKGYEAGLSGARDIEGKSDGESVSPIAVKYCSSITLIRLCESHVTRSSIVIVPYPDDGPIPVAGMSLSSIFTFSAGGDLVAPLSIDMYRVPPSLRPGPFQPPTSPVPPNTTFPVDTSPVLALNFSSPGAAEDFQARVVDFVQSRTVTMAVIVTSVVQALPPEFEDPETVESVEKNEFVGGERLSPPLPGPRKSCPHPLCPVCLYRLNTPLPTCNPKTTPCTSTCSIRPTPCNSTLYLHPPPHCVPCNLSLSPTPTRQSCYSCSLTSSLWSCLSCPYIGCGRYSSRHAYEHYHHTNHPLALELATGRIWDYRTDRFRDRPDLSRCDALAVRCGQGLLVDESFTPAVNKAHNVKQRFEAALEKGLRESCEWWEGEVARAAVEAAQATSSSSGEEEEAIKRRISLLKDEEKKYASKVIEVQEEEAKLRMKSNALLDEQSRSRQLAAKIRGEAASLRAETDARVGDLNNQLEELTVFIRMQQRVEALDVNEGAGGKVLFITGEEKKKKGGKKGRR